MAQLVAQSPGTAMVVATSRAHMTQLVTAGPGTAMVVATSRAHMAQLVAQSPGTAMVVVATSTAQLPAQEQGCKTQGSPRTLNLLCQQLGEVQDKSTKALSPSVSPPPKPTRGLCSFCLSKIITKVKGIESRTPKWLVKFTQQIICSPWWDQRGLAGSAQLLAPGESNKVPVVQPSHGVHPLTPLIPYSNDHFSHSSHSPHLPADINQKQGVHRPSQTSDIPGFYPLPPGGVGQITPSMGWFTHPLMLGSGMHTTGIPHPAIVPHSGKQDMEHYDRNMKPQPEPKREKEAKKPTIKKPLNAFMLYMKEMRAKVIAECTLKESAAINQILGRRWHALSREEQAKYYELARKERQLHMQLYPGWSARDNYGKKKRRTREKQQDSNSGFSLHPHDDAKC
ncbi:hypothetical protein WISP_46051 [Willisornis vidua]|uniref:HMG box domain-containing protein n=1 Tax=Willisornis vidua TaxID=1566151 RepID=A0ABQ9DI91_9PASS|nr:hypothetical protein WISP_46051 [Willisornis vidua]